MNSKRRTRAVFLGTLLVLACLTAIPTASEAFPIKWLFYPPQLGEPDEPGSGTAPFRIGGWGLSLYRLGPTWAIVVTSSRSVRGSQR